MVEIIIIAAIAKNGVIGKDNDIPWRIKEDFQHFKRKTLGCPCIMGDKTYDSLPDNARPLPGRENIVLSRDPDWKPNPPQITFFDDFDKAIDYVQDKEKAFITGGATIYRIGLAAADTLELTRIHKEYDGDTYFPEINWDEWELVNADKQHKDFTFETYKRKK